ncbi:hypothetical protein [Collimonas pratensis]|uniref:Lipase family protein n=1 Tax=Collimonas pratensis TaxID=279113 RepID=A0ABN4MDM7_9BURK|nr:hypothetical protein [Collimonas pratensis]AMP15467.1 lipase family protein [Collimonas pratensis]
MALNTTTNPDGRIDASNAGLFSSAAYSPKGSSTADQLGPNWSEDTNLTKVSADGSNQMRVFVNDATKQIVFAFKGSDNYSNFKSDLVDSGAGEYAKLRDQAMQSLALAKGDYPGFQIIADGHSLGGGMAQSFALENNLNGFGQNALPIASATFSTYLPGQDPVTAVSNYLASNQFVETNVSGDIATFTYSTTEHQIYLDKNPTTMPSIWGAIASIGLVTCGPTAGIGCAVAFGAGGEAHVLGTFNPLAQQYAVGPDGHLIVPAAGAENVTTTKTTNADGSYQVTGTDGAGNSVTGNFMQNGALVSDSWSGKDGTTGGDNYFSQNGKVQISQYNVTTKNPDSSKTDDLQGLTTSGAVQYEQVTNTSAAGQIAATISGTGASTYLNNAIVSIVTGAQATINGSGDKLYLGGSCNLSTNGTGMVVYTGLSDIINSNGAIFNIGGNLLAGQSAITGYTTINGTANIINAGTGTTLGLSGIDTVNGTGTQLFITANTNLTTIGTGMTVYTGLNDVISGNGDIFNIGGNLLAGQSAATGYTTISGNANIVNAGKGTMLGLSGIDTVNGTGTQLFITANTNLITSGTGMTVYTGLNDVINGNGDIFNIGGNLLAGQSAATGYTTISGNANIVNAGKGTMLGLSGIDTVNGTGTQLFITANTNLTTSGTGMTVYTGLNDVINGNGDIFNIGGNLLAGQAAATGYTTISGNANIVNAGTGTTLGLSGIDTVNGTGSQLFLTASANLTTNGSGMTVYTGLNDVINGTGDIFNIGGNLLAGQSAATGYTTISGNANIVNAGTGTSLGLSGIDTVNGTGNLLYLTASANLTTSGTGMTVYTGLNDVINGNGDIFNIGGNLLAGQAAATGYTTINGNANTVNAGTGTTLGLSGIDTVNGTGSQLFLTASANLTTNGSGMTVYTGLNDVINGTGDIFNIGGNLLSGQVATTGYTTINGNANTVNAGTGTMFGLSGSATINGTGDLLFLTGGTTVTANGANMQVYTAANDVFIGSGAAIHLGGNLSAGQLAGITTIDGVDTIYGQAGAGAIENQGTGSREDIWDSNDIETVTTYSGQNATGTRLDTSTYNSVGQLTLDSQYDPTSGKLVSQTSIHADGSKTLSAWFPNNQTGEQSWEKNYDASGNLVNQTDSSINPQGQLQTNVVNADGKYFDTTYATSDPSSKILTQKWVDSENQVHTRISYKDTGFEESFNDKNLGPVELIQEAAGQDVALALAGGGIVILPPTAAAVDFNFGSVNPSSATGQPWAFTHPPSSPGLWTTAPVVSVDPHNGNVTIYQINSGGCSDGSDPIILNLQGGKVQTSSLTGATTYFDMQNNGQKVQTGWATAGEGMLVYDPNNTGTVASDANLVAGFGALATLAHQTSGVLDASNSLWNELKIWVDPTGDANFKQGQLETLDQLGITSINLNSATENVDNNRNTILNDSTFTWKSGSTGDIAGVNLMFNPSSVASSATVASTSDVASSGSLNHLIQSMAAFTDGNTGIDHTFSSVSANADAFHLAASHAVQHA